MELGFVIKFKYNYFSFFQITYQWYFFINNFYHGKLYNFFYHKLLILLKGSKT